MHPMSPVVDVDIVVLDGAGRQVAAEKRKTNPSVPVNPLPSKATRPTKAKPPVLKSLRDSIGDTIDAFSDEEDSPPARVRQPVLKPRRPVVPVSDSDSDIEFFPSPPPKSRRLLPSASPPTRPAPPSKPKHKNAVLSSPESVPSPPPSRPAARPPSPSAGAKKSTKTLSGGQIKGIEPPRARPTIPFAQLAVARPSRHSVDAEQAGGSRPRTLTPIRSRAVFTGAPSPPSPTTPSETDADLSFDFAELALSPNTVRAIEAEARSLKRNAPQQPAYLRPLLAECGQDEPHEFSAFIEMFPFDPMVRTSHNGVNIQASAGAKPAFRKIGEASYSEVFGIGDVVLKIIPLRNEEPVKKGKFAKDDVECPPPSDVKDVLKEIVVTRAMGEMCNGFVELLRTYVVRGKYPSLLLNLWDEYHERKGSESIRPDGFTVGQVYAIIVLPNGGPDLESYSFASSSKNAWRQACSLFWQVTRALAEAEELVQFEHRDLHWGQILVKNIDEEEDVVEASHTKHARLPMDDDFFGVRATIIDLGLSRMNADGGARASVHWTPFDDEVFEGEGDYQFEVYRLMRAHIGNEWRAYRPLTNVMWLHYLADKLLHAKRLRKPPATKTAKPGRTTAVFSEAECHACLVEVAAALQQAVDAARAPVKGRRKTHAPKAGEPTGLGCAGDLLAMARERGWLA